MDPITGSAIIAAGTNILGNLLGFGSQQSTNKQNLKIMREQQAWQEKMWNKQNEYNTPENQLSLYQDAGYNPLTALNSMSGNSSAGSVGSVQSAQMQATDFSGFGQAGQAIANAMLQKDLIQSQIDLNNANAGKSEADTWYTKLKGEIDQQDLIIRQNMSQKELEQYDANIAYIKSNKAYIDAQKDMTESERQRFDLLTPIVINMNQAQLDEIKARIEVLKAQKNQTEAQTSYIRTLEKWYGAIASSQINLNNANANNANANAEYIRGAQTANTNANTANTNARTEGQEISNEINGDTKGFQKVQIGAQSVTTVISAIDQGYEFVGKVGTDIATGGGTMVLRNALGKTSKASSFQGNAFKR